MNIRSFAKLSFFSVRSVNSTFSVLKLQSKTERSLHFMVSQRVQPFFGNNNRPGVFKFNICQMMNLHESVAKCGPSDRVSSLHIKKRKRKITDDETREIKPGYFSMTALATAEEYDLEKLHDALIQQDLYVPNFLDTEASAQPEVLHATAKYEVDIEPREMFFFREGSLVMWNVPELECGSLINFIKKFEQQKYPEQVVQAETEALAYCYRADRKSGFLAGDIVLEEGGDTLLEKFTISNALALSVKLGAWEASLERYIDSIEYVTEDLKQGRKIKLTQAEVLRKTGELFALRHLINLRSDLLDTPDFYWDREHLEPLYRRTCEIFSISRRTKVMNERLSHCLELVELLAAKLSDHHHVRLEWMIIVLIMVEVAFEVIHYCDRFLLHATPS